MTRGALLLSAVLAIASPARGDTLRETIAVAYVTNPELADARALQEAREEALEQARVEGRPTLSADVMLDGHIVNFAADATREEGP